MASNGVDVSLPYQLPLGGAEPLSDRRLQVGQPGHHESDRPSRISQRFVQANIAADDYNEQVEIAFTDDGRRRPAEEEIRSVAPAKG